MPQQFRCLIVGAGCIGVYIARKLQAAQPDGCITLKARPATTETSAERQAHKAWVRRLCEQSGVEHIETLPEATTYDGIIIATKSDDVQQAALELANANIQAAQTLVLYNGILSPLDPDFSGNITRAVTPAGYAFDHGVEGGLNVVNADAPWRLAGTQMACTFWQDRLNQAGQATDTSPDNALFVLRKYLINTAVNPLTVIYQRKVDELLDDELTFNRIKAILAETIDVLHNDSRFSQLMTQLPEKPQLIEESLAFINTYRGHYTSAYHAFKAGDPIEIQSLTGYAISSGTTSHVSIKENQAVWQDIANAIQMRDQEG